MADRFPTEIKFGGAVTEAQLRDIAGLAGQCGLSFNYEQNYNEEAIYKALLQQMSDDFAHFELNDHEICPDGLDDLTEYLREHKLPYEIRIDAKYEYDAELHWWRPRMKKEQSWFTLDHEAKTAAMDLPALEKALKQRKTLKQVVEKLRQIPPPMSEGIIVEAKAETTTGSGKTVDVSNVKK